MKIEAERALLTDAHLMALVHVLYYRALEFADKVNNVDRYEHCESLKADIFGIIGQYDRARSEEIQRLTAEVIDLRMKQPMMIILPKGEIDG